MTSHDPGPLTPGQRWSLVAAALCAVGAVLLAALPMDWIEEVFGVEPDGGNGLLELVPVVVLAVAALVLCARVARARRRSEAPTTDTA
jgi:hypothetical protein